MCEVPRSKGGATLVFEPAVDGLGGAVGAAEAIEEREHVDGALLQDPAEAAGVIVRWGGKEAGGESLQ